MHVSFLDASKAFDRVDHDTLFRILKGRNVPNNVLKVLEFLYCNQKCQVSWDGVLSKEFCSTRGVKQGGVLSPHFFNVYMDELSDRLKSIRTGCVVDGKVINHLIYADDIVLFSPTANGLQQLLDTCNSFAEEFKLSFNPIKSVCMILNQNKSLDCIPVPTFLLQGKALAIVEEIKYLGSIISCNLIDDSDIADRIRWIYSTANILSRKFSLCNTVVKQKLFKTYFNQVYGICLWAQCSAKSLQRIKVAYNDAYRIIFNVKRGESVSNHMVSNRILTFQEMRRISVYRALQRFAGSTNCILAYCSQKNYAKVLKSILYLVDR